ncbi:hypothetical protein BH11MYX2_BH11MYX2_08300 [soil metagenome]
MTDVRGSLRFTAVLALLAGCSLGAVPGVGAGDGGMDSGSGSGSGSDDMAAAMAYTSNILPIVTAKTCTGASCHGGAQPPKLTSYADLKTSSMAAGNKYLMKPWTTNIFNTKSTTLGAPPLMHQGIAWLDATEQAAFMTFIDTYGI